MRILNSFAFAFLCASSAAAATVVPVGPFRSIELHHGGRVTVRHGAVQRVSIVTGQTPCTRVRVDDQKLIIDRDGHCGHAHQLEIDVVTPHVDAVAVSNGGTLQAAGEFPAQKSIDAAVEQGGRIDIRSIAADDVRASIDSGGGIFTTAQKSLAGSVESGGIITYWGDARDVRKSVRDGGAVVRGTSQRLQERE